MRLLSLRGRRLAATIQRRPAEPIAWNEYPLPGERLEVDKQALSRTVLDLAEIVGLTPYAVDELALMAAAFREHQPEIVIDIGTHIGKSARTWYELSRCLGVEARIHTIDLCDPDHPEYPGVTLGKLIRSLPIEQHIGNGYDVAASLLAGAPGATALVFLDGDHAFETVRAELELARLMSAGCILVHDTFFQPGSTYNHGPYQAIEEFCGAWPVKQVIHVQTGVPGLSYLRI